MTKKDVRRLVSEFDWLFEEVGSGVRALVEKFVEMPYFFYSGGEDVKGVRKWS